MTNVDKNGILMALGVIGILVLLFVPLPAIMLDFMFSINITLSVVILLTVLFINRALDFSSFPLLLLVTTMFRLSLNVASTRLILGQGHESTDAAGKIIETFGEIIIAGSPWVGLVVFLILVIVNFMVITKGAGRIAEVAARFTLDSLPGKQMAIDSDLNAGLIDETEARTRRSDLEQETGFFGAMDGASKFVRGDAIAGLIITALNIVAGMLIGVMTHGMTANEAAGRYMLLTIGDGLVAQIPALVISTAAGMLVAKSGTSQTAGAAIFGQLGKNPRALFVTAGLLFSISLLPGMPKLLFWALGGVLISMAYGQIAQHKKDAAQQAIAESQAQMKEAEESTTAPGDEPIASVLHMDTLRLELGYGLLNLIDESRGGRLTEQIKAMRRQLAKEIGFIAPSIRIQDNMQADPGSYSVFIKDINSGSGIMKPGMLMAMDPTGTAPPLTGEDTVEPTFGLPAKWVDASQKEEATFNGYTVVDNSTIIVTHLTEVIKDNLPELLTRAELQKLLDEIKGEFGKLVEDLVPDRVPLGVLQQILKSLLSERVSIRDLPTILEAVADNIDSTKNISLLTEQVRARLGRQICMQHVDAGGVVPIVSLSGGWEKEFNDSIITSGEDRQLAMEPGKVQTFVQNARDTMEKQMMSGATPVLLTSPTVRPFVRSLIERSMPQIAVLSQAEIHAKAQIKTVGTV